MTTKNDGGQAFPYQYTYPSGDEEYHEGMSLRDYFAGQAMMALLVNPKWDDRANCERGVAQIAGVIADAMLAEREKVN